MTPSVPTRLWPGTFLSLAMATVSAAALVAVALPAVAQQATVIDIPAGSLDNALRILGRQTGMQVSFRPGDTSGYRVRAVQGPLTGEAALDRLLQGTGLSWQIEAGGSVVIHAAAAQSDAAAANGTQPLGTIVLGSGAASIWDGNGDSVYTTPAAVDFVSGETLETYHLTNPADMFRGVAGVRSGEGRNSGSLNVNIHGMQGQGRVPVRVDGAENAAVVYRGYQGNSDRSFVDPDFIGSIGVTKGPSGDRPGIGGSVEIRTVEADDIILPGQTSGFRLQVSASGNTTDPEFGRSSGLTGGYMLGQTSKRPSFLNPTAGSASLTWAKKSELVDIVAGFAMRDQGNYHAGTHGPVAGAAMLPCGQVVNPLFCSDPNELRVGNGGLTPYFGGEEVMNTSNETRSGLIKARFHISDSTEWTLGYSHYDTTFGEVLASRVTSPTTAGRQRILSDTKLDSLTSRLRFNPAGNEMVDLRWNLWVTKLSSSSAPTYDFSNLPSAVTDNLRWGTEVSNTMRPDVAMGDLSVTVGASFMAESTKPDGDTLINESDFPPRNAKRKEFGLFATADWAINSLVSVNGSLRYSRFESEDFNPGASWMPQIDPKSEADGLDPSIGVVLTPWQGLQFYANYREATRLPSLMEGTVAYGVSNRSAPDPEHARNIDVGMNVDRASVFAEGDRLNVKLGYFDNRIKDYIARNFAFGTSMLGLQFENIHEARFRGIDLTTRYERNAFAVGLSATYYTGVEFCRTASTCGNTSLASDLAANHIPPKYQFSLDVSQKLLDDRLTLGGRVTRVGGRAADYEPPINGALTISAPILWKPYTTVDLFARYKVREGLDLAFDVENVTDKFYVEPLSLGQVPGPGRTARLSLDWRF